jgi:hypothetical protein
MSKPAMEGSMGLVVLEDLKLPALGKSFTNGSASSIAELIARDTGDIKGQQTGHKQRKLSPYSSCLSLDSLVMPLQSDRMPSLLRSHLVHLEIELCHDMRAATMDMGYLRVVSWGRSARAFPSSAA